MADRSTRDHTTFQVGFEKALLLAPLVAPCGHDKSVDNSAQPALSTAQYSIVKLPKFNGAPDEN